jgi:chromosomal replication initiation ATPase DnaA
MMALTEQQRANYAPAFLAKVEARHLAKHQARRNEPQDKPTPVDIENALDRHGAARQIMRDNAMPGWVREIIFNTATKHGVAAASIVLKLRNRPVVIARNEAIYRTKETLPALSAPKIAGWFGMDHTAILHALARHAHDTTSPSLTGYDFERIITANRMRMQQRKAARRSAA